MRAGIMILLAALVLGLSAQAAMSETAEEYYNQGNSKYTSGDYKEAIEDYDRAIELAPDYVEAYFGRGVTKIIMMQEKDGCLDLSKADELKHPQAQVTIKQFCNKNE